MNTFRLALVVFTAGLLCACDAVGQDEKKAESDADIPFEETLSKAKAGDVAAMFNLGVAYDNGKGVIEDDKKAAKWYRKAAVLGNATAMYKLGLMYAFGKGVIEDDKKAVKWYRKAADVGHAKAMVNLGLMYAFGKGVIENDKEAVKWYQKAADVGYVKAMVHLGLMYASGEGVIENDAEAYAWFHVAAVNGQKTAAKLRDNIKKNMPPEQIAEGQKRSREIVEKLSMERRGSGAP